MNNENYFNMINDVLNTSQSKRYKNIKEIPILNDDIDMLQSSTSSSSTSTNNIINYKPLIKIKLENNDDNNSYNVTQNKIKENNMQYNKPLLFENEMFSNKGSNVNKNLGINNQDTVKYNGVIQNVNDILKNHDMMVQKRRESELLTRRKFYGTNEKVKCKINVETEDKFNINPEIIKNYNINKKLEKNQEKKIFVFFKDKPSSKSQYSYCNFTIINGKFEIINLYQYTKNNNENKMDIDTLEINKPSIWYLAYICPDGKYHVLMNNYLFDNDYKPLII